MDFFTDLLVLRIVDLLRDFDLGFELLLLILLIDIFFLVLRLDLRRDLLVDFDLVDLTHLFDLYFLIFLLVLLLDDVDLLRLTHFFDLDFLVLETDDLRLPDLDRDFLDFDLDLFDLDLLRRIHFLIVDILFLLTTNFFEDFDLFIDPDPVCFRVVESFTDLVEDFFELDFLAFLEAEPRHLVIFLGEILIISSMFNVLRFKKY